MESHVVPDVAVVAGSKVSGQARMYSPRGAALLPANSISLRIEKTEKVPELK